MMAGQLAPQQTAAINLPASLFAIINDRPNVGVFFALYNNSVLFPVNDGRDREAVRRAEVVTDILAATVGPGIVFENLEEDVTIVLRVQLPLNMVRKKNNNLIGMSFIIISRVSSSGGTGGKLPLQIP